MDDALQPNGSHHCCSVVKAITLLLPRLAAPLVRSGQHAGVTRIGVIRQRGRLPSEPVFGSGASPALIPRRASRA